MCACADPLWLDESGATAIEYCLIAGVVCLAVITGATAIGTKLKAHYLQPIADSLS